MASGPITSWRMDGEKVETVTDFIFLGSRIMVDSDCSHEIKRCLLLGRKAMTNLDSVLETSLCQQWSVYSQSYGFSASHVQVWELDHTGGWVLKNWYFQTVVLEKTLENPLDCVEIKPVSPKGNHWKDWCWSWSSNTLATWYEEPTHWKKTLILGKVEGRRRGGLATKDEMVGWHHWLNGHESE